MRHQNPLFSMLLALIVAASASALPAGAQETPESDAESSAQVTPPRLSYTDGQVSYWRPGASDWAPAQINTPLAPGDQLYTGPAGTLELEIGWRGYVRAWAGTQLGVENQDPDFLQVKITAGEVSLDLRRLDAGRTIEVDTPSGAFTVDRAGYYRVSVSGDHTSFVTRRGGQASVVPADNQAMAIGPNENVIVDGVEEVRVATQPAPPPDTWDTWNNARTAALVDSMTARYVPQGVYGAADLERYGTWRTVETYGNVWVPRAVPAGWVPYSTGRWIWDPVYGWTWVDTAPWGWAPYHYGRWVFVNGIWAWAPGPPVVRPVYAPALVVFFGGAPTVAVATGGPVVGWCALGWGEPVVPWWGRPHFVGRPWWGGWGGPRVVNNVVINKTTVVNVNNITVYRNATVTQAVVAVKQEHFGRGGAAIARVQETEVRSLRPVHGAPAVEPTPASLVAATGPAAKPPQEAIGRRVVATRAPRAIAPLPTGHDAGGEKRGGAVAPGPVPGSTAAGVPAPPGGVGAAPHVPAPAPKIVNAPRRAAIPPAAPTTRVTPDATPQPQPPTERREPRSIGAPNAPAPSRQSPRGAAVPAPQSPPAVSPHEPGQSPPITATPPAAGSPSAPPSRRGGPAGLPAPAAPGSPTPPPQAPPADRAPAGPRAAPGPQAAPAPHAVPAPQVPPAPQPAPVPRRAPAPQESPAPRATPAPQTAPVPHAPPVPQTSRVPPIPETSAAPAPSQSAPPRRGSAPLPAPPPPPVPRTEGRQPQGGPAGPQMSPPGAGAPQAPAPQRSRPDARVHPPQPGPAEASGAVAAPHGRGATPERGAGPRLAPQRPEPAPPQPPPPGSRRESRDPAKIRTAA